MPGKDSYLTIKSLSEGILKDKGSRFIALAYPIDHEDQITLYLDQARKQYYDARHHCYAWVMGTEGELFRINDDGEPSGTAGKPIHGQILSAGLSHILIIVVRYFGGTKLGVRGLINAYRGAAKEAIERATIIEKIIENHYRIYFPYQAMNSVMKLLKDRDLNQYDQRFDLQCSLCFSVRQSIANQIVEQFEKIEELRLEYLHSK